MITILVHLFSALLAITLGSINLIAKKGTTRHRIIGYCWLVLMLFVTTSSFWIKELNQGELSWIHALSAWTLFSMGTALISIRLKYIKIHAIFMIGTMLGAIVAGMFAMVPGRFISYALGY